MVHEMCHLYAFNIAGAASMGAGDGYGKEWLEIVNQLNKEHPELDITLFADEKKRMIKKIRAQNPAKYQFIL